uniref:Uncharacterized protein n=1 Tax=Timema tahoe TaxID=61484 RepID=A0A7R9ITT5_9NEOP|nr:unnamed protein product [Timema tahoe]
MKRLQYQRRKLMKRLEQQYAPRSQYL